MRIKGFTRCNTLGFDMINYDLTGPNCNIDNARWIGPSVCDDVIQIPVNSETDTCAGCPDISLQRLSHFSHCVKSRCLQVNSLNIRQMHWTQLQKWYTLVSHLCAQNWEIMKHLFICKLLWKNRRSSIQMTMSWTRCPNICMTSKFSCSCLHILFNLLIKLPCFVITSIDN